MQANTKLKQGLLADGKPADHIPIGTWAVCRQLYEEDGIKGFWKGVGGRGGARTAASAQPGAQVALLPATFLQAAHPAQSGCCCAGLGPSLILVVNPAVQYAVFERLMATSLRIKEQRLLRSATAAQPRAGRPAVKVGPGEVFLLGEQLSMRGNGAACSA